MPPTKSTAGKLADKKSKSNGSSKGPTSGGMKSRMNGSNGVKIKASGMKSVNSKNVGVKNSNTKETGIKSSATKISGMKGSGMRNTKTACLQESETSKKVTGMKVTGMKGRMGGAQMKGGGLKQPNLPFKSVKKAVKRKPKKKLTTAMILSGNKQQDEALLKLRIPLDICTVLPSIKKFTAKAKSTKGQRKVPNMVFESESGKKGPNETQPCFSSKKRPLLAPVYEVELLKEHRFQGMIWDLAFMSDGNIVVTGSEGAMLCDAQLKVKSKIENMFLPGAIAFLSDGRILIVDRSSDTVNFYRRNASYLRSFVAGNCPMGMAVNSNDEILVSDTGDKCIRKFDINGKTLLKIPTVGENYSIRWPLYLGVHSNNDIVVSDVHQQRVLRFDSEGRYLESLSLKTHGGSCVLRPHGVCVNKNDEVLVIDTSIESLELFSRQGVYMQTLLIPDAEATTMDPKLCKLNKDNTLLGVGGLTGIIRLYSLKEIDKHVAEKKPNLNLLKGAATTPSSTEVISSAATSETSSQASGGDSPGRLDIKKEPPQEDMSR